jgi:tetratricopeptide (TPR) repeat protein
MKKIIFFLAGILLFSGVAHSQYKLYENGLSKYKSQDYSGAITQLTAFLNSALHDKKFEIDAYYYRGLSYYKTSDWQKADNDFQETLLLNHANKGNIYWFMAKCQDKLSNYDGSAEQYTNSIRELGGDTETKVKLLYERGLVYSKAGKQSMAYDDLKLAASLNPSNPDVKRELDKLDKQGVKGSSQMVIAATSTASSSTQKQQPNVKKDEPVQKNTPSTEKKEDAVQNSNGATPQSDASSDNLIASRLAGKKSSTQVSKTTSEPKTNSEPAKTIETPLVVNSPPSSAQKTVATVVNPIADAYKDERRFALVIGNSKYPQSIGVLKNPVNDATDIAKELEKSNFDVQLLTDATYGQMRAAMLKFKEKVDAGEKDKTVALFYYAGHGLAHDDENYLVPIDAMIEYEDDIARYCFGVQRMVLANMERSNSRMNIVILDACRNNPFPALTRSAGQQGLGEMKRARGSFIAYATAPGSVASDGSGRNGLYTQELLKAMRKPGLTIEQVFKEVRASVGRMSGDKQNTWDSSNIIGEFYFKF